MPQKGANIEYLFELEFDGPVNTVNPCHAEPGYTIPLQTV